MKAITLHQPWAHLVAIEAKTFETRSWATSHRGLLAVHAGRDMAPSSSLIRHPNAPTPSYIKPFDRYLKPDYNWLYGDLAHGAVVALVEVQDCRPADFVAYRMKAGVARTGEFRQRVEEELAFGDFSPGRWAWRLRLICQFEDGQLIRGRQGLWNLPPDDDFRIRATCAAAGLYLAPNSYPQLPERIAA